MPPQRGWKQITSWALYDWANSAYATTVIAGLFPVFFKEYWSTGASVGESTLQLGAANSLASIVIVVLAPVLGAIADRGSAKKKFLLFFTAMGVVMTGGLYFVAAGHWQYAAALYVLGTIGFSGGNIFYDALIVNVAEPKRVDFVSALGFALGYLGGGILFAVNVYMTLHPEVFGLADQTTAVRVAFVCVAVWWGLFSLPLLLFVHEPRTAAAGLGWRAVVGGFRQLKATFQEVRRLRVVFLFLLGYWLYIDGVDTIVRMAVDYGMSLGFPSSSLIVALLITQFVGFPAAIAFGKFGERIGAKHALFVGIGVYVAVCIWGYYMDSAAEFYAIAVAVGLVQGGVQALSRSFYTRIIPASKAGEFFGFYNMLGKFAAVIGPLLMGWVSVATGNPRYSILSLIILFGAGAALLYFVDEAKGRAAAAALERV
jgi:UMF1 family MFS transporter